MSKDTKQLYGRAAATARKLSATDPATARLVRALLSEHNRKDRELKEWKEGRAFKALEAENFHLRRMIQERAKRSRSA